MSRYYQLSAIIVATSLAGCSHPQYDAASAAADARAATLHITCQDKTTCATKWARAVQWVSDNSYFKIRLATDSLITTEGPLTDPMESINSAMSITKVPLGNGTSEIAFKSWCTNDFGCVPTHNMLLVQFADFVNGAPPATK